MDYSIITIDGVRNEKDFFMLAKSLKIVTFLWYSSKKIVYDPLKFEFLDSNVYLYEEEYDKCSNHKLNEIYTIPILQKTPSNLNLERIFQPI